MGDVESSEAGRALSLDVGLLGLFCVSFPASGSGILVVDVRTLLGAEVPLDSGHAVSPAWLLHSAVLGDFADESISCYRESSVNSFFGLMYG